MTIGLLSGLCGEVDGDAVVRSYEVEPGAGKALDDEDCARKVEKDAEYRHDPEMRPMQFSQYTMSLRRLFCRRVFWL